MDKTREKLEKAIKHYKCERDNAIVVLDSGFGSKPGQSDLLYRNRKERAQIAIDAIEKQIPQKPIRDSLADRACPSCDAYIPFDALNDRIDDAPLFCKHCGQALDWGNNNDTY